MTTRDIARVANRAVSLLATALPADTPNRDRLEPLYCFLAQVAALQDLPGMERAVLRHGAPVPVTTDPRRLAAVQLTRGQAKECAANTSRQTLRRPDLLHVEGFGTSLIPVWHCWPATRDGRGFDVTWPPADDDRVYLGLPFDPLVVAASQARRGWLGVLPDRSLTDEWLAAHVDPILD